jgi:DNA/RNA-binding domain of Phe-tRNA-synthetase-like protein
MQINEIPLRLAPAARASFPDLNAWAIEAEWAPGTRFGSLARTGPPAESELVLETLATHPRIAIWRNAYRAMGLKPSECRSSIEQLVRRHLRGDSIGLGIAAVDLYNQVSIAFLAPMGGYDLDRLSGEPLVLRPLQDRDAFTPLGGNADRMPLMESVLGYCQGDRCLCYAINHRDAAATAIRDDTMRALFVSEAVDAAGATASRAALEALSSCILQAGGHCSPLRPFRVGQ